MKRFLGVPALILLAALVAVLPARAGQRIEILPVAALTIYPGDIITDAMLSDGRFLAGTSAKYPVAVRRDALIGKVARRTLLPGRLIGRNTVAEPELVGRGTIIPAVYEAGDLRITASVLALQSGALGDLIQVRNIDSGKVIVGVVLPDGTIRVGG